MVKAVDAGKYMTFDYRGEDNAILGEFILLSPGNSVNVAELRGFEIYPKYRGKGLSYDMLAQALNEAREYKFNKLRLQVKRANEIALKLYYNAGFIVTRDDFERDELEMEIEL